MHTTSRRHWQVAGALIVIHVLLVPVGIALQHGPLYSDGAQGITDAYVEGNLARSVSGGIIEAFGFLLLVPGLVFLARALGRRSETGAWAAQTGLVCGVAYVAVTFAVGFPAGAAAMYGAQHGLDVDTAYAINNLRIFSYFLSLLLVGGSTLGIAISALTDGVHRRWIGGFGVVTGILAIASTPLVGVGLQDLGGFAHLVWLLGVGVLLLRHREVAVPESRPEPVHIGQA